MHMRLTEHVPQPSITHGNRSRDHELRRLDCRCTSHPRLTLQTRISRRRLRHGAQSTASLPRCRRWLPPTSVAQPIRLTLLALAATAAPVPPTTRACTTATCTGACSSATRPRDFACLRGSCLLVVDGVSEPADGVGVATGRLVGLQVHLDGRAVSRRRSAAAPSLR